MEFLVGSALVVREQVGIVAAHEVDKPSARHELQRHAMYFVSM
jgi:hypothetical protein